MRKINIIICIIFLGTSISFAQGGIYSICDPKRKYLKEKEEWLTLEKIVANMKDITIIEFHGGWKSEQEAKERLIKKLLDKEIKVSSAPLWNMDTPVELIGIIEYTNGSKGKIAIAQHRVGFQDKTGKPWYFQWEERIPWE